TKPTASGSWSLDFIFLDQYAIPTLVECKLKNNAESRRKIVGQMLDYAANCSDLWTARELKASALHVCGNNDKALRQTIQTYLRHELEEETASDDDVLNRFFEEAEKNLREKRMRLVFFLDEAPLELKMIVDYLGEQMKAGTSDVFLVEINCREVAVQSNGENLRSIFIASPSVYGFTEKARRANSALKRTFNLDDAFIDIKDHLAGSGKEEAFVSLFRHFSTAEECEYRISAGGVKTPTIKFFVKRISIKESAFRIFYDGAMTIFLESIDRNANDESSFGAIWLRQEIEKALGELDTDIQPYIKYEKWAPHVDKLIEIFSQFGKAKQDK
ncbi:MAG: hypothetical protein KJ042_08140, partial [Deltaproteobacteria bacterium]|nr:hypothetical protein [Deltaproteobacteria bacterium]